MFRAHVLIVRRSKLYYTASGIITLKQAEWSKITKMTKICKYKHIAVKFMCEFFGCDVYSKFTVSNTQ